MKIRKCNHCHEYKEISEFYSNVDFCKTCISEEDRNALERLVNAKLRNIEIQKILDLSCA